jgi:hypothetical protein
MYEAFDDTKVTVGTPIGTVVDKTVPAPNDSQSVGDLKSMLQKVETLMQPQIQTPEIDGLSSSFPTATPVNASGLTKQPESHDSVQSQPGDPEALSTHDSLKQGKSFQAITPGDDTAPDRRSIQQDCPPAVQCPDMRQYIRKDSIPCWACKLK